MHWPDDSLHIGDGPYLPRVACCPVRSRGRPPIVDDQCDVVGQVQGLKPGVEIARVVHKPIGLRWRFTGLAHPHQVRSQAAAKLAEMRDDVPPKIGRCGIAVQEDDRVSLAGIDITHLGVEHRDAPSWVSIGWVKFSRRHRCYLAVSATSRIMILYCYSWRLVRISVVGLPVFRSPDPPITRSPSTRSRAATPVFAMSRRFRLVRGESCSRDRPPLNGSFLAGQ